MNQALQISCPISISTPHGRIPFLRYDPQDVSIPRPMIIYLHGAARRSLTQTTTTVRGIESSTEGVMYYTNSAHPTTGGILPTYQDPNGNVHHFYMLAPQLYGTPGDSSETWNNQYITRLLDYAEDPSNGMNVDKSRFYLCGFSLGAGGTITALNYTSVNRRIAAAAGIGPGYYGGSTYTAVARCGVPLWLCHAANDSVAPVSFSDNFVRNVRAQRPLYDVKYERWETSSHSGQFRLFDINSNTTYTQALGSLASPPITPIAEIAKHSPNMYEWFLRYARKDNIDPLYI